MRVNFTLEATGSFTFGYDIQSYVKILLCIQIIECFALETSSWSVCQEQGKTGGADWQSLSFKLQKSKKEYNSAKVFFFFMKKGNQDALGMDLQAYTMKEMHSLKVRETIISPKLAAKMTIEIHPIMLNNIAQFIRLSCLKKFKVLGKQYLDTSKINYHNKSYSLLKI